MCLHWFGLMHWETADSECGGITGQIELGYIGSEGIFGGS